MYAVSYKSCINMKIQKMNVNMTSVFFISYCLPKIISYSKSSFCVPIKKTSAVLSVICNHLSSFSHVVDCLCWIRLTWVLV